MKLSDMELGKLMELRNALDDVCERIAITLTDYRTMSRDIELTNMNPYQKSLYSKRIMYVHFRETVNTAIEGKLDGIIASVENEKTDTKN